MMDVEQRHELLRNDAHSIAQAMIRFGLAELISFHIPSYWPSDVIGYGDVAFTIDEQITSDESLYEAGFIPEAVPDEFLDENDESPEVFGARITSDIAGELSPVIRELIPDTLVNLVAHRVVRSVVDHNRDRNSEEPEDWHVSILAERLRKTLQDHLAHVISAEVAHVVENNAESASARLLLTESVSSPMNEEREILEKNARDNSEFMQRIDACIEWSIEEGMEAYVLAADTTYNLLRGNREV